MKNSTVLIIYTTILSEIISFIYSYVYSSKIQTKILYRYKCLINTDNFMVARFRQATNSKILNTSSTCTYYT